MFFGKISIILLIVCVTINAQRCSKKRTRSQVRKTPKLPTYGCQNPLIDLSCGCRGAIDTLAPFAPVELAVTGPLIDVPNYRYVDPSELNPLGCLFPTFEVPNYSIVSSPAQIVEIVAPNCGCSQTCPKSCGCPAPQCGCGSRAPAVKLPVCQEQAPMYVSSVIELPSYGPLMQVPCGCQGNPCGCQGACGRTEVQILPCGCQGTCGCTEVQILPCGCQGSCGCPAVQMLPCGCQGSCGCQTIQVASCSCPGACDCGFMPISTCECVGPCMCSSKPQSCGCNSVAPSCGCVGPCGCSALQSPALILPAVEVPYTYSCNTPACGCGAPACGCSAPTCGCGSPNCGCNSKYLRQVTLQPPFL